LLTSGAHSSGLSSSSGCCPARARRPASCPSPRAIETLARSPSQTSYK
jgi:hypothetical protein